MSNDKMRAQFEAWITATGWENKHRGFWDVWQAALEHKPEVARSPIGDTTCPHTPNTFPTGLIDQLRFCANALETEYGYNIFSLAIAKSIERIEQLERELAEAQKGHARYEFVRKLNVPQFRELYLSNLHGDQTFDDRIDADISGEKE